MPVRNGVDGLLLPEGAGRAAAARWRVDPPGIAIIVPEFDCEGRDFRCGTDPDAKVRF